MTTVNVYLNFNGNCRDAFKFYQSVFGGELSDISIFGDMPPQEGMPPVALADQDKIMHVSLPISDQTALNGSDYVEGMGPKMKVGNNFSISIATDEFAEGSKLFGMLSEGGNVTMPLQEVFWGGHFGSCEDKFGINWMVSCPE